MLPAYIASSGHPSAPRAEAAVWTLWARVVLNWGTLEVHQSFQLVSCINLTWDFNIVNILLSDILLNTMQASSKSVIGSGGLKKIDVRNPYRLRVRKRNVHTHILDYTTYIDRYN